MHEYPYWWDTVQAPPLERETPEITKRTVDVAIIGAGYTGLAAARHLARVGASVLVLERDQVGAGASSRSAGQVLAGFKTEPATLVSRYGERRARELFEVSIAAMVRLEALVSDEAIDCGLERTGHLQAAYKPAHFDAFRDEQRLLARVFAHRVDLVTRRDQRGELGSDRYHG